MTWGGRRDEKGVTKSFLAQTGAEPIANHDRRTLIKGDHIIGVKQRFPVAWAAPKRSWLTEPMKPAASS